MKFTNEQIEQGLDKIFDNLLQTKDVEASESMEITPDEGYAGIKKVNLTVKGGGGSGGNIKYYLKKDIPSSVAGLYTYSMVSRQVDGSSYIVGPSLCVSLLGKQIAPNGEVDAVGVDFDAKIEMSAGGQMQSVKVRDLFASDQAIIDAIPTITEEEFYNLNA